MSLLGAIGSIGGGLIQAGAQSQFADDISDALNVRKIAYDNGFSLRDVFGKKPKLPNFKFQPKHFEKYADRIGNYAAGRGSDNANALASKINENTVTDLEAAMDRMFGGDGSYARQRDAVAQNTEDMLAGNLSQSTRRLLGRRAVTAGASGIGPDAVSDTYAGYLGMATEDIVTRGTQQYQSLYAGYRQALPLVTGFDALNYTAPNMGQGLETFMRAAENNYQAKVNKALVKASPDPLASGLVQAEMARLSAVASANLNATSSLGSTFSSGLQQLGGLGQGAQSTGGGLFG